MVAPFDDPIPLPPGRQLVTLEDAGAYITKLPKSEHTTAEWQAAMEALILVATLGGPTMFARIGIMGRPEAEEAHRMKLTRRFAELTSEKRLQDPRMGRPARPNLNRRQEFPLQRTREMAMPQANP